MTSSTHGKARIALVALFACVASVATRTASAEGAVDRSPEPVVDGERSVRAARPLAVRGEVDVLFDGVGGATDGFAGATVAYSLDEHLSVEGTFGWGFGNYAKTGANALAMGRFALPIDRAGVHALTFAVGPSTFFGGDYGAVWLVRGEIAYELRTRSGFSLLAGGGPSLVLADSRALAIPDCSWFCPSGKTSQFKAGDVPLQVRVAAGWAF